MLFSVRSLLIGLKTYSRTIRYNNVPKQACNLRLFQRFFSDEGFDIDRIVEKLCKGDGELEKKLRILMLEVDVMRQDGRCAPDMMKESNWEYLLELPSKSQRLNYLKYLWKTEKSRQHAKEKKAERRKHFEECGIETVKEFPDDLQYGMGQQSMFIRIREQSMNDFYNYRAIQAMLDGQNIVIDCSYEDQMVQRETTNAAKQVTFAFGDNRIHKQPFNLRLCNVDMDSHFMKELKKLMPFVEQPWFPMNIHEKSYLDIFHKKDLVYLTPHCREELTTFDHDAVYIIGCLVDKVNNEPLSMAKAKREGIRMAKLPLDRYLEWGTGAKKNLNINHMVQILLDLKVSSDWEYALRHVPRRKLMKTQILATQKDNSIVARNILKNNVRLNIRNNFVKDFNKKHALYDDPNKY